MRILGRLTAVMLVALAACQGAHAMQELAEEELSGVSGAGLALSMLDWQWMASASSYLEATGFPETDPDFQRGDARWYGISFTGASSTSPNGQRYGGGACSGINCPIGGPIALAAPEDNPFIFRVFDYATPDYINPDGSTTGQPTVLEVLFPVSNGATQGHDPMRVSFWTELVVGLDGGYHGPRTDPTFNLLQSQLVMDEVYLSDTKFRLFQFPGLPAVGPRPALESTYGLSGEIRISGNLRFSARQQVGSPNTFEQVPDFADNTGLYFTGVDTYLPLGQLHYQAIILDDVPAQDGNFKVELTIIPDIPAVFNDFYSTGNTNGYSRTGRPARYNETHGFWKVGDGNFTNNTSNSTADGVFFRSGGTFAAYSDRPSESLSVWEDAVRNNPANPNPARELNPRNGANAAASAINLGEVNMEGILIQHMSITSLAGQP